MRYCGNCGVQLFEASLAQGRCRSCGASITREGDIVSASEADRIVTERWHDVEPDYRTTQPQLDLGSQTQAADSAPVSLTPMVSAMHNPPAGVTPATLSTFPTQTPPSSKQRLLGFGLLGAGIVGVIVLSIIGFTLIAPSSARPTTAGDVTTASVGNGTSIPRKTPVPKHTPLPGTHATATPGGHATPTTLPGTATPQPTAGASPTLVPTSTPVPSPTPIPTPTSGSPAAITLSPMGSSGLLCLNNTTNFYIVNSGGTPLNWTVTVAQGNYTLAPSTGGTWASGAQQNIIVSGINGSGQIQVSDPNASNSPQDFTITCAL